ncbi:MAG: hypothetical protein RLZZ387_5308 [Chloroflexota bacterium]
MDYEPILSTWAERLRREEPRAVAVLCHGSYARGAPEPHSDLDMDVLLDGEPEAGYRSAFEELPDGRLLHITIASYTIDDWLEQFEPDAESEEWAFFLPARQSARLLWATDEARRRLEGRVTLELAHAPQLQDLLESAAKVRNAMARGDELGVRLGAQDMALRCPGVLGLLSPLPRAESRRAALAAALDIAAAPPGYPDAMLVCLGLSGCTTTAQDVHDAAIGLARAIVGMLEAAPERVAGRVEPGLAEALADGRVMRLLTQPE